MNLGVGYYMNAALRTLLISVLLFMAVTAGHAQTGPDCSRPLTLALHEHGLLYSSATGQGIDQDIASELIQRSGCRVTVSLMARSRIWQLIETGALDFSLSGITNEQRDGFASFAWYFSNKYYLLARKDAHVKNVEDFENNPLLMLGVIRSFRYGPGANQFVDRLGSARRLSQSTGLDPLYQALTLNHIQGMIIEPFDYPDIDGSRILALANIHEMPDDAVPHGLIMSRKSLPPAEQEKWRTLIKGMRTDGTVLRIFEKYFAPELARTMVNY
jgi:polar amino acid transport system substrate-binding protein